MQRWLTMKMPIKALTFVRYRKVIYEKIIQIKGSNEP